MYSNKIFLITGASSGLGKELAIKVLSLGAKVSLCARRKQPLLYFLQTYGEERVLIKDIDVTNKESISLWVKESIQKFGRIDVVIANAGQSMWSRFRDIDSPDDMKKLMDVNYMGVVNTLFYSLAELKKSKGSFVAISSIQGVIPAPYHAGYVAAKHAVNGFIETMRMEEPGINFMLAMPGWISGTELRQHAVVSSSKDAIIVKLGHGSQAMSSSIVASKILNALHKKNKNLIFPKKLALIPILRTLFPKLLDFMIKKKVASQIE